MKSWVWKSILFLTVSMLAAQSVPRFVSIEAPSDDTKRKNILFFDIASLESIINGEDLQPPFTIEIVNAFGGIFVELGLREPKKIKWKQKKGDGEKLEAECNEQGYAEVLEKLKKGNLRPGLYLRFSDKGSGAELKKFEIVTADLSDLEVYPEYPTRVAPGENLNGRIIVRVENKGSIPAENVQVRLILSADEKVTSLDRPAGDSFQDDQGLPNGELIIPVVNAGKTTEMTLQKDSMIPADMAPEKYFLAAVVDPNDTIPELNEANNLRMAPLIVSAPAPAEFRIDFPGSVLTYEPAGPKFTIEAGGILLSDGKDWKFCKMSPTTFQIRHIAWQDFFWEIDTQYREIFEVRGTPFCKKGGKSKKLNITVETKGGGAGKSPQYFTLKLGDVKLVFDSTTRHFNFLVHGHPCLYPNFWKVCKPEPHLLHVQYAPWGSDFLEADSFRNELRWVKSREMCKKEGGEAKVLTLPLTFGEPEIENLP